MSVNKVTTFINNDCCRCFRVLSCFDDHGLYHSRRLLHRAYSKQKKWILNVLLKSMHQKFKHEGPIKSDHVLQVCLKYMKSVLPFFNFKNRLCCSVSSITTYCSFQADPRVSCVIRILSILRLCFPPLIKEGHIALQMSVGLLHMVQLKTPECFAPEASNMVGR